MLISFAELWTSRIVDYSCVRPLVRDRDKTAVGICEFR
jgi:hypothetical protein